MAAVVGGHIPLSCGLKNFDSFSTLLCLLFQFNSYGRIETCSCKLWKKVGFTGELRQLWLVMDNGDCNFMKSQSQILNPLIRGDEVSMMDLGVTLIPTQHGEVAVLVIVINVHY